MRIALTMALGLTLGADLLLAEGAKISTRPTTGELAAPTLPVADGAVTLSLDQALTLALERNLGLAVQRYDRESFRLGIEQALAIYDLNLSADFGLSDSTTPAASNLDGADVRATEGQNLNFGVSQLTPLGGTISGSWTNNRSESNSSFALLNPSFSVGLGVEYRQPLLRNFGRENTEYRIRIAELDSSISRETLEQQATLLAQQVTNAYWELVEARQQVEVAEESLALAKQLHDINKVRVEVGTLAPLELVQSEAGIATREEEIIRARARVGDAEDTIRRLLGLGEGQFWDLGIRPSSAPQGTRFEVDAEAAWKLAVDGRPELRSRRVDLQKREIELAYRQDQTKPQLNLVVGYGLNGIGGDTAITCDTFAVTSGLCDADQLGEIIGERSGGWDDAAEQVLDRDFDRWNVQLAFSMPLQNRAAKTSAALARLDLDRARVSMKDLEQEVLTEVRKAARGVRTAAQQIDSAKVSRQLAEKNLEAEQKRYDNGLSTSFQVLQIQEDLSQARSREVNAVASYERAVTEFRRATGSLLSSLGVEWADE